MAKRRKKVTPLEQGSSSVQNDRPIRHLVTGRESDMYGRVLMASMMQQTMIKVSHLAGAAVVSAAGLDLFDHPDRYGAVLVHRGKTRQVWVQFDDVMYAFTMGSAAIADEKQANAFAAELQEAIAKFRPAEVWVVAFARLVRSAKYGGQLLDVCQAHVECIHCEVDIHPSTHEGALNFQLLSMISSAERDYIVRRHTAGRVMQARRGEWIPIAVPPGYRLVNRKLELDPEQVGLVRKMLELLANHSLGPAEVARRLGAEGLSTTKLQARNRDSDHVPTISDARNPTEIIGTLLGWVDALETGRYEVTWRNPIPGVRSFAGLDVQMVEEDDIYPYGVLIFPYTLERPEGGWAPKEVFDLIRARPRRLGRTTGPTTAPLAGFFRTARDGREMTLASDRPGTYKVLSRPVDDTRTFIGWNADRTTRVDARISRTELHQSISRGVASAAADGVLASIDRQRFVVGATMRIDPRHSERRRLERQLSDATEAHSRAVRNARLADDDVSAKVFVDDVVRHEREMRRLTSALAEIEAADPGVVDQEFNSVADMVVYAIGALEDPSTAQGKALGEALRVVISHETLTVAGAFVSWELFIELPHPEGVVTLGPITGRVANLGVGRAGRPVTKAVVSRKIKRDRVERLRAAGIAEVAASVAAACPDDRLTAALADPEAALASGADPGWVALVSRIYRADDFRWEPHQWRPDDRRRQELLDFIAHSSGSVSPGDALAAGFSASEVRHLTRDLGTPTGTPVALASGKGPTRRLTLIACPHCGGVADLAVRTPEVSIGLLCSSCRRPPTVGAPEFPGFYVA